MQYFSYSTKLFIVKLEYPFLLFSVPAVPLALVPRVPSAIPYPSLHLASPSASIFPISLPQSFPPSHLIWQQFPSNSLFLHKKKRSQASERRPSGGRRSFTARLIQPRETILPQEHDTIPPVHCLAQNLLLLSRDSSTHQHAPTFSVLAIPC